jgi:Rrf2 family protein
MKLSTKGRYGLRALLVLAQHYKTESPVLLSTIAEDQEISPKYLHAILTQLKLNGIVRSIRGSGGGFTLSRRPETIRISEVLKILEGSLSLVDCVDDINICHRAPSCITRRLWIHLSEMIENKLKNITLEELAGGKFETNSIT